MKRAKVQLLFLLLGTFCVSIQADVLNQQTMAETLPVYSITNYLHLLNSSTCRAEMQQFREAVDHGILWGLRMLDASGKPPSGFIEGNNFWMGSNIGCKVITNKFNLMYSEKTKKNNSLYRNPAEERPPYKLHFFTANIQHNSTLQYHVEMTYEDWIVLGLCLPASCTENEIATMLHEVLRNGTLLVGQLFSTSFKLISINDLVDDHRWLLDTKIIIIIVTLTLLCSIILTGTILDLSQRYSSEKSKFIANGSNNAFELKNKMEEGKEIQTNQEEIASSKSKSENLVKQCFLCFSLYSNVLLTFKQRESSEDIRLFHSLKFLGIIWIVLGHMSEYGKFYSFNKIDFFGYMEIEKEPLIALAIDGALSVDIFFFISGFLLAYACLKLFETEKVPKSLETKARYLVTGIINRYIRLTPALCVVIMMTVLISTWQNEVSEFPMSFDDQIRCSKYWWRNLLYINNFYDFKDICLSWSWYLPNDFQFFIFGLILLLLSIKHYKIAIGIGVASLLGSAILIIYVAKILNVMFTFDSVTKSMSDLYIRPWARIQPYLIGMTTAIFLQKWNYKLKLSKKMLFVCWTLTIFSNCSIMFSFLIESTPAPIVVVLFFAFHKIFWALGVAWFVIACCTNNAGIINKFLTLRIWIPLGRLTYSCYLVHPLVISSIFRTSTYSWYFDFPLIPLSYTGYVIISYVCALVLAAAVEMPFIRLLRILEKSGRKGK